RGTRRARRGQRLPNTSSDGSVLLRYRGLDGVERRTRIRSGRRPDRAEDGSWVFLIPLEPHDQADIEGAVACAVQREARSVDRFDAVVARTRSRAVMAGAAQLLTSNAAFNKWIRRSFADLQVMVTDTPNGAYPYAGIPWFSAPFGRDGILTALELL